MNQRVTAVIVSAGAGRRFGGLKHRAVLGGISILERTLSAFESHPEITGIVVVMGESGEDGSLAQKFSKIQKIVPGGKERQDSVINGVRAADSGPRDLLLVHDGVRPLVSPELISRVIQGARETGAAVPIIPLEDTIKRIRGNQILSTVDRNDLGRAQTPQGFRAEILTTALEKALKNHERATDEAALVERIGNKVLAVPGEGTNLKITTPRDLRIAEVLIED